MTATVSDIFHLCYTFDPFNTSWRHFVVVSILGSIRLHLMTTTINTLLMTLMLDQACRTRVSCDVTVIEISSSSTQLKITDDLFYGWKDTGNVDRY
jgi:hypothetical protein